MDIQQVPIDQLKFAPYNPRQMKQPEFEALQRSIDEFQMVEPVVANKRTGNIVGGHMRVRAARALGMTEVPVYWVDLDDGREKALNIALNKISGEWDDQLLAEALAGLDEEMQTLSGYTEDEIARLAANVDHTEKNPKLKTCPNCGHQF